MDCGDFYPASNPGQETSSWWEVQYQLKGYGWIPADWKDRKKSKEEALVSLGEYYSTSEKWAHIYLGIRVVKVTHTTVPIHELARKPEVEQPDNRKLLLAQE